MQEPNSNLDARQSPYDVNEKSDGFQAACRYRIVQRSPWELIRHPILAEYCLGLSVARLSAISDTWDPSWWCPICIAKDGKVLKGLEEWELARKRNLQKVNCLEFDLNEEEIVQWILDQFGKTEQFNDFVRILIARKLKPFFSERGKENERLGGLLKGSINLPKAQRIDSRAQIARAANVADRQVSDVDFLLENANPPLLEALRGDEVSIHKACLWVKTYPDTQLDQLTIHRTLKGLAKKVDSLRRHHRLKPNVTEEPIDIQRLGNALATLDQDRGAEVIVGQIQSKGKVLLLSRDLLEALESQGEFTLAV